MGFYEEISKYYDYIFPTGQQQLKFIQNWAGTGKKKVLDVACGSGGYSIELAKQGYEVTAADLDEKMVELAINKARNEDLDVKVIKADMSSISSVVNDKFDCAFCIGNSIVHLDSKEKIKDTLIQLHELLGDGGVLILQIINFDRVMKYGINELPTLANDDIGLEFIRKYQLVKDKGLINFNTVLKIENTNTKEVYENTIELLPLLSGDLMKLLKEAQFRDIEFYGDFNYSEFNDNSFMLVVKACK